jgi:hypothetical protein
MTRPALILIILGFVVTACNPVISGLSLLHSISKGDAFSAATSVVTTLRPSKKDTVKKKSKADIMEDLRKALGETNE